MHPHHDLPRSPWPPDWRRPSVPADQIRISDAERAEVSNALCRHFGDGRLDDDELAERLAGTAAAKTRADLAPLLADLPRLDPPADAAGSGRRRWRRHRVPAGPRPVAVRGGRRVPARATGSLAPPAPLALTPDNAGGSLLRCTGQAC
jgi:hypothetical protein